MKVKEVSLRELLKGQLALRVPPFQRRYAWGEREFQRLWDDITSMLDGEQSRHFMGTVVLEPFKGMNNFSVIDGQQRLATFTVLARVLLELSEQFNRTVTPTLRAAFLSKQQPKFIPSLHDIESFALLYKNPTLLKKSKHRNVWACHTFFNRQINNFLVNSPGTKSQAFAKLVKLIFDHLFFVRISLTDKDDAQGIFETINYTGVPLTAADLARNFVLGQANDSKGQEWLNNQYWQPIESAIEESVSNDTTVSGKNRLQKVLPEFLRAVLVVERRKYISFSDLYRELRLFLRNGNLEENLKLTLYYAEIFKIIANPEYEKSVKLKAQLIRFKSLRMTTHYPLLLVLYRSYLQKHINVAELLRAMQYIESFVVRRAFNSKVSRDLNLQFSVVTKELCDHHRSGKLASIVRNSLAKKKWPTDQDFKINFVSSPIYTTAPTIARYALVSIEQKNGNHREKNIDHNVQIEHVFPQQPGSGWTNDLGELKKNLHVIGNLSLTAYNSKYSNKSFKEKLTGPNGLKKSPFWLNRTISQATDWTSQEVKRRGERLLREAMFLWPGPEDHR
jgi:uncharacterized protein with ParB-like and HNH nuclease domain